MPSSASHTGMPDFGVVLEGYRRLAGTGDTPNIPPTDTTIRRPKPRHESYKVADFEGPVGLVKPTASRFWHQEVRVDSKERLLAIGACPEISVARAWIARDAARAFLATGKDPSDAKQLRKRGEKERRGLTFKCEAQACGARTKKQGRVVTTLSKSAWLLHLAINNFSRTPMSEITSPWCTAAYAR